MHKRRRKILAELLSNNSGSVPVSALASWYVDLTKTLTPSKPAGASPITFTRASAKNVFDSTGTLVSVGTNVPGFDYNPSTLIARGLLIEEARTNLSLSSQDIRTPGEGNAVAAWSTFNTSVSSNSTTAPDGTSTADTLIEDAVTNFHTRTQPITKAASAITYTSSVFVKQAVGSRNITLQTANTATTSGAQVIINPSTGAIVQAASVFGSFTSASASVQTCANGWFRVSLTYTTDTDTTLKNILIVTSGTTQSYAGDGTSGFYVWGMDVEAGAFSTSYIPTTTAAVTRAADIASITGASFSSFWNATQGTLLVRATTADTVPAGSFPVMVEADDTTANNRISLSTNSFMNHRFTVVTGGVLQTDANAGGTLVAGTFSTWCIAYQLNNIGASANGGAVATDTSATIPTVTALSIGSLTVATNFINGWISYIVYYPVRNGNTLLQRETL